ncbi:hypothetical protein CAMRE0001_2522 [Campylobacter rectus RM3267]|uniref:Uncharacterized protein n=1 Tax=Campylobacter rectus RM3267 TaxID=553218 RepID=B9D3Q8_CAMRE|nr:hypothetical protein CAMRE0001_2522 [Campylobacter rectus RM3267]
MRRFCLKFYLLASSSNLLVARNVKFCDICSLNLDLFGILYFDGGKFNAIS